MGGEDKKRKKHRKKHKKKHKKKYKKHETSSSSSSGSESDEYDMRLSSKNINSIIVELNSLLKAYPNIHSDLCVLLKRLDSYEKVIIIGIDNDDIRHRLKKIFKLMKLKYYHNKWSKSKSNHKNISFLDIFEEVLTQFLLKKDTISSNKEAMNSTSNNIKEAKEDEINEPLNKKRRTVGPSMPPNLLNSNDNNNNNDNNDNNNDNDNNNNNNERRHLDDDDDDDDDDTYGPVPIDRLSEQEKLVQEQIRQLRQQQSEMKEFMDKQTNENDQKREDWMTQLPDKFGIGSSMGVQSRGFLKTSVESVQGKDQTIWTDTPQQRKSKAMIAKLESVINPKSKQSFNDDIDQSKRSLNTKEEQASLMELYQREKSESKKQSTADTKFEWNREKMMSIYSGTSVKKELLSKDSLNEMFQSTGR